METLKNSQRVILSLHAQVTANDPNVIKQGTAWKGIKNYKAGLMIAVIIGVYLVFVLPVMLFATLQVVFDVRV